MGISGACLFCFAKNVKDKIVLLTFADLLINLSAGWLIIATGAPFLPNLVSGEKIGLLLYNLGVGILCLMIAIWIRKGKK